MRTFIVTLLTAVLLVGAASIAVGQEPASTSDGADTTVADVSQDEVSEAETTDDGGTNWVRIVGLTGIVAVWWARGLGWVSRRRKDRSRAKSAGDVVLDAAEESGHLVESEGPGASQ